MTATPVPICGLAVRHTGTTTAMRRVFGRTGAVSAVRVPTLSALISGELTTVRRDGMSSAPTQRILSIVRKLVGCAESHHRTLIGINCFFDNLFNELCVLFGILDDY